MSRRLLDLSTGDRFNPTTVKFTETALEKNSVLAGLFVSQAFLEFCDRWCLVVHFVGYDNLGVFYLGVQLIPVLLGVICFTFNSYREFGRSRVLRGFILSKCTRVNELDSYVEFALFISSDVVWIKELAADGNFDNWLSRMHRNGLSESDDQV